MIFKKIVKRIQFCNEKNICHLDIKPANIVFDDKFKPIIIDFGLSKEIKDGNHEIIYKDITGTKQYECPEMWKQEGKFTGVKADIFSLGALLFNLIAPTFGFWHAEKEDDYYGLIIEDKDKDEDKDETYKKYWDKILPVINNITLSKDFKKLYTKMIAYDPEKRPSIEEILAHPWFNEIKNLDEEKEKEEIKKELNYIYEEKIKKSNTSINNIEQKIEGYKHRADKKNVFPDPELRAKKIPDNIINPNRYIIIDGYLEEREFMNTLYNQIKDNQKDLADDLSFIISKKNLKFGITFVYGDEDEEEEFHKKCIIDIELFKYGENRYLLDFLRKGGSLSDYYKNFEKIKDIIQFGKTQENNKLNKNKLSL